MFNLRRFLVRSFAPIAFVVSAASPGCECDSAVVDKAPHAAEMIKCVSQTARRVSPPLTTKTVEAESIPTSFGSTGNGDGALSMNLATLHGRGGMKGLRGAGGAVHLLDADGDGLSDAFSADSSGRLVTWMNTGKGFVEQAENLA